MAAEQEQIRSFQTKIWTFYSSHGRQLPWRSDIRPYAVLVSEIMLQQTQVSRVVPKFQEFLSRFPDMATLAAASQAEVLRSWQGLGYNRRARWLHQAAQQLIDTYGGVLPAEVSRLQRLPGIGPNTAGSIAVFAYNQPMVFIETNIRSVFLYEFFPGQESVEDTRLWPYLEAALDETDPRQWHWALMDYGAYLKQTLPNPSRRSRHHVRQTPFRGSKRQIRGAIIHYLGQQPHSFQQLQQIIADDRLEEVLEDLGAEGLIEKQGTTYYLGG